MLAQRTIGSRRPGWPEFPSNKRNRIGQEPSWEKDIHKIEKKEKRMEEEEKSTRGFVERRRDIKQERMHRGEHATRICRRKEEGHELDVEEASDKPRRDDMTEKGSLSNGRNFPGDIMACHGGGKSTNIECL
jgi:hypothetical protein